VLARCSRRPRVRTGWSLGIVFGVAVLAAGCANTQSSDVTSVAGRFYAAAHSGDGGAACALLAPRTRDELEQSAGRPCEQAIVGEDLSQPGESNRVSTFGTAAQVRYAGETTFLSRFKGGWLVVAAGCSPARDRGSSDRYDCHVEAG
jgi:hypothetical protein